MGENPGADRYLSLCQGEVKLARYGACLKLTVKQPEGKVMLPADATLALLEWIDRQFPHEAPAVREKP